MFLQLFISVYTDINYKYYVNNDPQFIRAHQVRMQSCFDERGKNILAACIAMGLAMAAVAPSAALMNIALAESTDIALEAG